MNKVTLFVTSTFVLFTRHFQVKTAYSISLLSEQIVHIYLGHRLKNRINYRDSIVVIAILEMLLTTALNILNIYGT